MRGDPTLYAQPYQLHRYASDGSLAGRYEMNPAGRESFEPPDPSLSGKVFALLLTIGLRLERGAFRCMGMALSSPRQ